MTRVPVNTASFAINLFIHTCVQEHKQKYFPLKLLCRLVEQSNTGVLFPHILAKGQIPLCSSQLFLDKHSGEGGREYNIG